MQIQDGDWVRTDSGLAGRVIHVNKLTAFVELALAGGKEVLPILLSELIRVDPSQLPSGPTVRAPAPDGGIGSMAQTNLALQKLIHTAQTELTKIEGQLSENSNSTEASQLVELAEGLQQKIAELRAALNGELSTK